MGEKNDIWSPVGDYLLTVRSEEVGSLASMWYSTNVVPITCGPKAMNRIVLLPTRGGLRTVTELAGARYAGFALLSRVVASTEESLHSRKSLGDADRTVAIGGPKPEVLQTARSVLLF